MTRAGAIAAALLLALAACSQNIDNKDAVRAGVVKFVSQKSGLNMDQMDVIVTAVSFRGKTADATVTFTPKGSQPASGVTFQYQLERQKDEWVVTGRNAAGSMGHGQQPPQSGEGLPPGHPPLGSGGGGSKP